MMSNSNNKYSLIPYACHIDSRNILTKNGEIVQVIEIVNKNASSTLDARSKLSSIFFDMLNDNSLKNKVSLWVNLVRDNTKVKNKGAINSQCYFFKLLKSAREDKNCWLDNIFDNRLFVGIVIALKNKENIIKSYFNPIAFSHFSSNHREDIQNNLLIMNQAVQKILAQLGESTAKPLEVVKADDGNYYSEQMALFCRIIYKKWLKIKLNNINIDNEISKLGKSYFVDTKTITEISVKSKKYLFAHAMFLIKSVNSRIPIESINKITAIDCELIITHVSIPSNKNCTLYDTNILHRKLLDKANRSEVETFEYLFDYEAALNSHKEGYNSYVDAQVTITIQADSASLLNKAIRMLIQCLLKEGILFTRVDSRLEYLFYSQLPGNLPHIVAPRSVSAHNNFCLLSLGSNFIGKRNNNLWGEYLSIFKDIDGEKFFFNLHDGNSGHTAAIGGSVNFNILINFLATQFTQYDAKLVIVDYKQDSRATICSISGDYLTLEMEQEFLPNIQDNNFFGLNLFHFDDNSENRLFVRKCLSVIVDLSIEESGLDYVPDNEVENKIDYIVDEIFAMDINERYFDNLVLLAKNVGIDLSTWANEGIFGGLFNNRHSMPVHKFDNTSPVGIDITNISENKYAMRLFMLYFMHSIEILSFNSNGHPLVIIFKSYEKLHNFSVELSFMHQDWLDKMRDRNVVVIFKVSKYEYINDINFLQNDKFIKSYILAPDKNINHFLTYHKIKKSDFSFMSKTMNSQYFLFLQNKNSILLYSDISDLPYSNILGRDMSIMNKIRSLATKVGFDPESWINTVVN